jgi:glucan phosphoethanolaminetransferase (alkaline phosphatase superfamily)
MQKKLNFEILSWLFAMVFAVLFIFPIYMKSGGLYPFYISNAISIIVFLTFTRLIFLLAYTPYSHSKWLRMVLIFLPIPLFMYQIDGLFEFQKFVDEEGTISFFKDSFELSDYNFGKYIKYQYIFFSVAALVTVVLLPIRMVISFWRTTNTADRV